MAWVDIQWIFVIWCLLTLVLHGPSLHGLKDLPVFWIVTKKAIESVSMALPNEQNSARLRNPAVRTSTWPI